MKPLTITIASVPDRDYLVIELWYENEQWSSMFKHLKYITIIFNVLGFSDTSKKAKAQVGLILWYSYAFLTAVEEKVV